MQNIWQKEMKYLEATAVQALINGDQKSIESGKERARQHKVVKDTVNACISILQKYADWSNDGKGKV